MIKFYNSYSISKAANTKHSFDATLRFINYLCIRFVDKIENPLCIVAFYPITAKPKGTVIVLVV